MFGLDLEASNIILIGAIELSLLLILIILFLIFQNRSLKKLVGKLRSRMQTLVTEIRKGPPKKAGASNSGKYDKNYRDFLKQQIKNTQARHLAVGSKQDIALDIDLAAPLPRRVAALRYAILQAEIEGCAEGDPNWASFENKYEQIFTYFEEFSGSTKNDDDANEVELLTQELTNAKKRINNLEKFKALYFDLDERWQTSKDQAQKSYSELSGMAEQFEDSENYERLLNEYHAAYSEFAEMLERGVEEQEELESLEEAKGEIRHLRAVAAEQHSVITDLKRKLDESETDEEKALVAEELQGELSKQMRFVQESETCIKLLEDELSNANKELEQLRTRVNAIPSLKSEVATLKDKNEELDNKLYSLQSDNRRISQKLEEINKAPPQESAEIVKYKRALNDLQTKYNELEEKFLDLKIQQ